LVVQTGAALVVVELEPWVLPVGASAEVGREPIAAADASVDDAVGEADK
jgi:hypothetical protein